MALTERELKALTRERCKFVLPVCAFLLVCAISFSSFRELAPVSSTLLLKKASDGWAIVNAQAFNRSHDPQETTFYDDPQLHYSIGNPIQNWDKKRQKWLELHPSFASHAENRIFIVTGSQPSPCTNPIGDHLLMRCFKNKVDYCRLHGYDIIYNNAILHPKMDFYWAKIPMLRATMLAHPEAEWIWWIDSDAIFTDMDYKFPLQKYKHHNLVIDGSVRRLYEKRTWLAINAGVFLIRNCQWSLDLLDVWANMGPISPNYEKWGQTFSAKLTERMFIDSDDQSALVYLILEGEKKWADMIYIEHENSFNSYWLGVVERLENISDIYMNIQKRDPTLRRRHAELVSEGYSAPLWEKYFKYTDGNGDGWQRPFITHFPGCQPCNGNHNPIHKGNSCWDGMEKALNFADNQVLRNYGFVHPDLSRGSLVSPLLL